MKEIVTFTLSGKECGVEVSRLHGIEKYADMMEAPDLPECMQGAVTIRNELIPVFDIKRRLTLPAADVTPETKYLVLRTRQGKLAIVVDDVSKIVKAEGNEVQNFPALLQTDDTSYAEFIIKSGGTLILTMNPEKFLEDAEWKEIQKALKELETGGSND